MKTSRFAIITLLLVALSLLIAPMAFAAYPEKTIEMVIPMPPGAAGDVTGRLFAAELTKILDKEVVILNKPGASLTLGTDMVVRAKKDGYTLSYTATSGIIYARVSNPDIVPYNPETDLEPLALHLFFPLSISVKGDAPWKTFADLVKYAKENPGKIRVGTHGQASIDHFNMEITEGLAGVDMTPIPFKGGAETLTGLLGGHVEVIYDAYTKVRPYVESGEMRMLAVSRKMPDFPDVPTLKELGYDQDLLSAWFAIYAPAGIPQDVKDVLVPAVKKAIEDPAIKDKINKMGYVVDYQTPEQLMEIMKSDYARALKIYKKIK